MPLFQTGDLDVFGLLTHTGTTPIEINRCAGMVGAGAFPAPAAIVVDTLFAVPLIIGGRARTLDEISFEVTTGGGAGSVARVGIYQATSAFNIYPNARIVDGGEVDTTTAGVKTSAINVTLRPNTLYWCVYLCGVAAPTVRITSTGIRMAIGASTTGIPRSNIDVAFAYAALPDPFTAGGALGTSNVANIFVRFSA